MAGTTPCSSLSQDILSIGDEVCSSKTYLPGKRSSCGIIFTLEDRKLTWASAWPGSVANTLGLLRTKWRLLAKYGPPLEVRPLQKRLILATVASLLKSAFKREINPQYQQR
jgi:hypothetical protein